VRHTNSPVSAGLTFELQSYTPLPQLLAVNRGGEWREESRRERERAGGREAFAAANFGGHGGQLLFFPRLRFHRAPSTLRLAGRRCLSRHRHLPFALRPRGGATRQRSRQKGHSFSPPLNSPRLASVFEILASRFALVSSPRIRFDSRFRFLAIVSVGEPKSSLPVESAFPRTQNPELRTPVNQLTSTIQN